MRWFLDISTRGKMMAGFGLVFVIFGIVVGTAYKGITTLVISQRYVLERESADETQVRAVRYQQALARTSTLAMFLSEDKADQERANANVQKTYIEVDGLMDALFRRNQDVPDRLARLRQFAEMNKLYKDTRENQVVPLLRASKDEEARRIQFTQQRTLNATIEALADQMVKEMETSTQAALVRSEDTARETLFFLVSAAFTALVLGVAVALYLTHIIATPLRNLAVAADRIAAGDLALELPAVDRADETGMLFRSFVKMVGSLREVMRQIGEGVAVLASAASEVTATTSQVAGSSAETASAVAETTATVEEVKQTAQLSAQKAQYVSDAAQRSAQISQNGQASMAQSVEAMHRIQRQMESVAESIVRLSERNQAIGEIIATVNDLAEQSNLLAVNAAIEAAKAGEEGKGFAVVAQEIKNLAEQSKQATAQVRTILSDIQKATTGAVLSTEQGSKAVETGVALSAEVGKSIQALSESIIESAQVATQIAASSQQQLVGVDQVASAMQNIKQASAQNVEGTKQTEISARNLHKLGETLKQLVERFKV